MIAVAPRLQTYAPPPPIVVPAGAGALADVETGELLPRSTRAVLADDVRGLIADVWPDVRWRSVWLRGDRTVGYALGPVRARALDAAYPTAATAADTREAEYAMCDACLPAGTTPAGRALALARQQVPALTQWRPPTPVLAAAREALVGGWQRSAAGSPPDTTRPAGAGQAWYHADIRSAYPAAAHALTLPRLAGITTIRREFRRALCWRISARQSAPVLAVRHATGQLSWGELVAGWYVRAEVEYWAERGFIRELRVHAALVALGPGDRYLAPTVEHLAQQRTGWAHVPVAAAALKAAINGLCGKFAARGTPWRVARAAEAAGPRAGSRLALSPGTVLVHDAARAQGSRDAHVLWTALITARVRLALHSEVERVARSGAEIVWTHTDSVVARVPLGWRAQAVDHGGLGGWRVLSSPDATGILDPGALFRAQDGGVV